jgi:hypothetical protein
MVDPNLQLLEEAATILRPVLHELVFVGGCATGLLITDPAAGGVRPTTDVDAVTEVSSYGHYSDLAQRLRQLGLTEDNREEAPICRWRHGRLTIDIILPTRAFSALVTDGTARWSHQRRMSRWVPSQSDSSRPSTFSRRSSRLSEDAERATSAGVLPDAGSQARRPILMERLGALSDIAT